MIFLFLCSGCYHVADSAITFLIDSENVAEEHDDFVEEELSEAVLVVTHTAADNSLVAFT